MPETTQIDNIYRKIALNVRKYREEKNLTQEKLAGKADLDRAYIGYIERAERRPSVETLARIAKSLDVELHELFVFSETTAK